MLIIIQARLSSKRLPGKVLKKINGLEIIKQIVKNIDIPQNKFKIVVATSSHRSDKDLIDFLKRHSINYYSGPLNNVLKRLLNCALKYNAKYFIRINGDSPFIDFRIIKKMMPFLKKNLNKYDLITNVFPRTFPKGQSVEIIRTDTLREISEKKLSKDQKEHVTKYFYDNDYLFRIKNINNYVNLSKINLSVDTCSELSLYKKKLKNVSLLKKYSFQKIIKIIYDKKN